MNIIDADNYDEMSRIGADLFCTIVKENPRAVICLASGGSPHGMFKKIAEQCQQANISTEAITLIKLDEWYRLAMDHPATCEYYLHQEIVTPLGLRSDQVISFDSDADDPEAECRRVADLLAHHTIDLCVLGLGANGHLGLNEPGAALHLFAHTAALTHASTQHPMLEGLSIDRGMTMGMKEIFSARRILFLVTGAHKRAVFSAFNSKKISTENPATLLWLHPSVDCVVDREAIPSDHSSM